MERCTPFPRAWPSPAKTVELFPIALVNYPDSGLWLPGPRTCVSSRFHTSPYSAFVLLVSFVTGTPAKFFPDSSFLCLQSSARSILSLPAEDTGAFSSLVRLAARELRSYSLYISFSISALFSFSLHSISHSRHTCLFMICRPHWAISSMRVGILPTVLTWHLFS